MLMLLCIWWCLLQKYAIWNTPLEILQTQWLNINVVPSLSLSTDPFFCRQPSSMLSVSSPGGRPFSKGFFPCWRDPRRILVWISFLHKLSPVSSPHTKWKISVLLFRIMISFLSYFPDFPAALGWRLADKLVSLAQKYILNVKKLNIY